MQTYPECVSCFPQQALDACRRVTDEEEAHLRLMRRVLEMTSTFRADEPPPAMAARIHRLIREESGERDPYAEIKRQANRFALDLLPRLQTFASDADDPFEAALRLSIAANVMDWGVTAHTTVSEDDVERELEDAAEEPLFGGSPSEVWSRVETAQHVLYLADNAGEIAVDGLFVLRLPADRVTVAVKGGPAINDATMEDARQVGLTEQVKVIDNGNDAPGTLLDDCSSEFRTVFESADLVISKGQGNYESLSERPEDIVFLLKAKCPVAARHIGCEMGDMVLLNT